MLKRIVTLLLILSPAVANAYIGPGAGLGAFAVLIAVCLAVLLLAIGFIWYPLKRFLRSKKGQSPESTNNAE